MAVAEVADLYGDSGAQGANGTANGHALEVPTGPAKIALATSDVLSGVGKMIDIEFGIAATDQGVGPLRATQGAPD